jgi:hypothetical protein
MCHDESRNCDRKWSEFQTPPIATSRRAECLVYHIHVTEPTTNEAQACQGAAGRIGSGLERGEEWVGRGEPEGVPGKHQPPPPTI